MKRQLYFPLLLILLASLVFGVLPWGQPAKVYAASTAALYPGTVITTAAAPYNGIDWDTDTAVNVGADDGVYAKYSGNDFDGPSLYMYRLDATNFGFTIPAGATIDGIVLEFERSNSKNQDALVRLIKGGTPSGNNNSASAGWAATDTIVTFGNSTDKWGLTWTVADINASNFGVAVSPESTGNNAKPQIDFLRITVYYTPPPADISNTPSSWAFGNVDTNSTYATGINYVLDTSGFRLTNNSAFTVNITISAGSMEGGVAWPLADDGVPTATDYALKAGTQYTGGSYSITVTSSGVSLRDGVTEGSTLDWGLQFLTPTSFSDGASKSGIVTLTATAA